MEEKNIYIKTGEEYISKALTLPYVKINRREFLYDTFKNESSNKIEEYIKTGNVELFSRYYIDRLAKKVIKTETNRSSAAAFATGLPGGYAIAGTIPADILQNLAHSLRLAQKLAYLYGENDLHDASGVLQENGYNTIIAYFGVMLGSSSATAAIGLFSKNSPKEIVKILNKTAVTKTVWYPIIKSVAKFFGIKVTKGGLGKVVQKSIPVVGGFISGGITYVSLSKSGENLRQRLSEVTYDYSEKKAQKDLDIVQGVVRDYGDEEKVVENNISSEI
ncbi:MULTISPECIES: hypothetical protein [Gemella]|uniref:hypothetical protein n=1 Tax=Gemella TaxID=1378 RepID=UPI0009306BDD|nr:MULTISPECIES: hypothetical protein [Gemella]AXI26610.1 hypothetical protein CG018_03870 [Gemella sp. ND 6198]